MTAPVDLAEEAFYDRATDDLELVTELGHTDSDERIIWGRDEDVLGAAEETPAARDFPLLTYFAPTSDEIAKGRGDVPIQCDIWVWPQGAEGGIEKLAAIDGRLYDLFNRTSWTFDGRRYFCRQTAMRARPPGSDGLLHRIRELVVGVGG